MKNKNIEDESNYLYANEQRDLYRKTIEQHNSSNCTFSRNLIPYLESSHFKNDDDSFYARHLGECNICQKKARSWIELMKEIRNVIPSAPVEPILIQEIQEEMRKFSVSLSWQEKERQKEKIIHFFQVSKNVLVDIGKSFFTRIFFRGLIWVLLTTFILYLIKA
jgi:hypothetical protein